jgi:CRP/FNR family transcriptional regulator
MTHPALRPPEATLDSDVAARRVAGSVVEPGAWQHTARTLSLLRAALAPKPRLLHAGDFVYQAGERFSSLYILNSGVCKIVNLSADGREHVVGLRFRGDWLGFDSIAADHYTCDVIALETGEAWALRYDALLASCRTDPAVMGVLHNAMSREIARDRESLMSVCTLPAHARVADFLRHWAESLATLGMRTDQIALRMTRAEIGNSLGMTLETVSRAMSKLSAANVIAFAGKGRREITIPDLTALTAFITRCSSANAEEFPA